MYINSIFELTLVLDSERFYELFTGAYDKTGCIDSNRYVDQSLASKGIIISYRDKKYKKKVQLNVNSNVILDGDVPNSDNILKLIHKIEKRVDKYFSSRYGLNDFKLSGMVFTTDIDVGGREKVSAYIKVLQRVGKVKGFSPPTNSWLDDDISLCLDGNSNGITFMAYDLEGLLMGRMADSKQEQLKSIAKKAKGLIRAEVRLIEPKAIRAYTDETDTSKQIAAFSVGNEQIFLDTFMRIVPFGDFYKKDKAVEIIRRDVTDQRLRRRMLRLLELIPEKKSLLLAQKALNIRNIDKIMAMFAELNVSPVTISKRHDVKYLKNLYDFLLVK